MVLSLKVLVIIRNWVPQKILCSGFYYFILHGRVMGRNECLPVYISHCFDQDFLPQPIVHMDFAHRLHMYDGVGHMYLTL